MKKRDLLIAKKRILASALAASMMLSVAGCGKDKQAESGKGKEGSGTGTEASVDVKNCTFETDPDFVLDTSEGDITGMTKVGDGMAYMVSDYPEITDEMYDEEGSGDEVGADEAAGAEDGAAEDKTEAADGAAEDKTEAADGVAEDKTEAAADDAAAGDVVIEDVELASAEDADMFTPEGNTKVHYRGADGTDKVIYETEKGVFANNLTESNGNLALSVKDEKGKTILKTFDLEGKEVSETNLSKLDEINADGYVADIEVTNDGDIIAVLNQKVVVLDKDGNEKKQIDTSDYIMGAVVTQGDEVLIFTYADAKIVAKKVDAEAGTLGDSLPLKTSITNYTVGADTGSGDYDFFYTGEGGLYGYKKENQESVKLCDFNASYIDESRVQMCVVPDEDHFVTAGYDYTTNLSVSEAYRKVDPANVTEKRVLKLSTLYADSALKQNVIDFNKAHSDVRIDIVEYINDEDPYGKMSADIAAGNLPDLYDMSYGVGNSSITQAIQKGMIEDLTPYLEKDSDISESDFLDSIMNAVKYEGKIYYIPSSFSIMTLLAKKADVGDRTGWTFDEMKEYIDSKPEDVHLFEDNSKSSILMYLTYTCLPEFVDFKNGTCNFDSENFKKVLELANRGNNEETEWDEEMNWVEDLQTGKQLFIAGNVYPDVWALYQEIFKDEATCVGFPNSDRQGTYASLSGAIAMSKTCSDKDLAWEFIKFNVSREQMGKSYYGSTGTMPVRKDIFEAYLKSRTATKEYTDEFGNEVTPIQGGFGIGNVSVEIKPLTDEEIQTFRDLTDQVSRVWEVDQSLYEIVEEESKAYFAGDKSVDETAATIQNRAQTYINESR